ncbi:MAG: radical SAM protein [Treponema sp.]|nr:radical SAM protein [Treponema sp.]MCL2251286.1 radical SAM protein [Treponema sp.]
MHLREVKSILSAHNGMNISRGCTHGCIYCDSRSKCYRIEHDFEDVQIKSNAPLLLEDALKKKRKKCMIGTGAMTDPYLPIKENLANIRACLEIIYKYGFGLAIQTKSDLILNDLDLLISINKKAKCIVETTLTTYDEKLCAIIEPDVCTTKRRFEVLKIMNENGIQTIVWLSPFLPFINDTEENLRGLLDYCINAKVYGILCWGIGLTLREGNREYFYSKLDEHFPGLKNIYQKKYGLNYIITSDNNEQLMKMLRVACKEHNIILGNDSLFEYMHTFEEKNGAQIELF